ncbi:hypothetical protein A9G11_04175 [Gilliamella sp. wkB108]|uniref:hypothetical protein n=1 Tax=Gilliamella sp. wkB108 TaxID=3120256 RepID=UPI00080E5FAE|nr:hypothetical protein [Gilliamella apicola]OCG23838.1 hypothetical protein A9G11_04175 [Gilliamella apicola]
MKNLKIKKVALGLLLTGYAASSAFATLDSQTNDIILGNEPVFTTMTDQAHGLTVRVYTDSAGTTPVGKNKKVKVGNYVFVKFKLDDSDGDKLNDKAAILHSTIEVLYTTDKTMVEPWTFIPQGNLEEFDSKYTPATNEAQFSFKIPTAMIGAEKLGFTILERTQYGMPYTNKYLLVTDITDKSFPLKADPGNDPRNPNTAIPDENVIGHDKHGPGDIDDENGVFPIEGDDVKVGIFKYNADGTINKQQNYKISGTPKYKDKFAAIVWVDDKTKNDLVDNNEMEKTSSYTMKWYLTGEYKGDDGQAVTASADELKIGITNSTGTNDTIVLGDAATTNAAKHNTLYSTVKGASNKDLLAGIQGYKLKVEAD